MKEKHTVNMNLMVQIVRDCANNLILKPELIEDGTPFHITSGGVTSRLLREHGISPFDDPYHPSNSGPLLILGSESLIKAKEFIFECKKVTTLRDRIGTNAITDVLHSLLGYIQWKETCDQKEIRELIKEQIKRLEFKIQTWTLLFPIQGMKLKGRITIGNVTFTNAIHLKQIGKTFTDFIHNSHESQKETLLELGNETLQEFEKYATFCTVTVESEESFSLEMALANLERVLQILRSYHLLFFPQETGVRFGVPDNSARSPVPFLNVDIVRKKYRFARDVSRFYREINLSSFTLNRFRRTGQLSEISALIDLNTLERSELQTSLLHSFDWFARAHGDPSYESLYLIIALETLLFGPNKTKDLTESFALRLAHILGTKGNERSEMYDLAKDLYGLRCNIVHTGRAAKTELSRYEIIFAASQVFRWYVRIVRKYKTHNDLNKYFQKRLLS